MKWFIKALRHYADFSGRARRREYWMFALFNLIFLFVFAFLFGLMAGAGGMYDEETLPYAIHLIWFALVGLPGMAVTVRRLHDLGKSGWTVLVGLIPLIGGIWLLILMCTDGQTGPNRFGSDPKATSESFPERAKLTSAGVTMIVAASLALLSQLLANLFPEAYYGYDGEFSTSPLLTLQNVVFWAIMLAAGILFVRGEARERLRPALWMLLVVCCYFGLPGLLAAIRNNMLPGVYFFSHVMTALSFLSVAILTILLLFAPQDRKAVRGSAVVAMVAGGLCLVAWLLSFWINPFSINGFGNLFNPLTAIRIIAWIVLAWTFLSRKEESAEAVVSDAEFESAQAPAAPSDGEALIHLYRPGKMAGAMIGYDVYLDDKVVWRARNGSRTTLRVTAEGAHTVMAKTEVRREITLDVAFGRQYYIRCGMQMGLAVGRPKLELVDNAEGKTEFDRIRL
jgi:uncharacterized membrane protein YhaH (DUF805 family)